MNEATAARDLDLAVIGGGVQPEPTLPIHLANEAFSRRQSWVEGALEAADAVIERL